MGRAMLALVAVMIVLGTGVAWGSVRSFEGGIFHFATAVLGAGGGMLADRFGPRIVCSAGMALIALGLLATSWATSLLAVYLSYGLLVGLGIALVYTPSIASVQPWFTTRRGLAGGIASSGVGAGTLLVPVLVAMAIGSMPWREAMQVLALGVLVLGLLAAALLRRAPIRWLPPLTTALLILT